MHVIAIYLAKSTTGCVANPMDSYHLLNAILIREDHHATNLKKTARLWVEFGRKIRKERQKRGMKVEDFAKKLECTVAMINFMETGKRAWPEYRARRASHILTRPEQWPDV